jgi:hypothetical protein
MATLLKVLNNLADSDRRGALHFTSELRTFPNPRRLPARVSRSTRWKGAIVSCLGYVNVSCVTAVTDMLQKMC